MRTRPFFLCMLGVLLAASTTAGQDKPVETPKPVVKIRVTGITEQAASAPGKVPVAEGQHLHEFIGRNPGTFYLGVEVRRELPEKTRVDVEGVPIELTFHGGARLKPQAVTVEEKYLDPEKTAYVEQDRSRWVKETYWFAVIKGQRSWEIALDGKPIAKALDYYTTLVLHGLDGLITRIKMPDGSYETPNGHQQTVLTLPEGKYDFTLEIRAQGKFTLPFKSYKAGETKYVAFAKDPRNVPIIPAEKLRKGLPKILYGYNKYRRMTGTGGGAYNIGSADDPVHVQIQFGRDGNKGPLWKCAADQIEVEFGEMDPKSKRSRKEIPIVKITETYNRNWEVRPWEKADVVEIDKDAREVVGEMVCGRLVIRSTEKSPSKWTNDGFLEKGFLYDEKLGYFDAKLVRHGEVYILTGESAKGP